MPRDCERRERARGGWEGRLGGGWLDPLPWSGGTRRGYLATSWAGVYMNPLSWYNGYYLPSKQRKRAYGEEVFAVNDGAVLHRQGRPPHLIRSRIEDEHSENAAQAVTSSRDLVRNQVRIDQLSVVIRVREADGSRRGRIRRPMQAGDKWREGRA